MLRSTLVTAMSTQETLQVASTAMSTSPTRTQRAWNSSSLVIDSLCDKEGRGDAIVAGLCCDFLIQQEQTVANIMGAILKQLVGRGNIPGYLRKAFQEGKRNVGGRGLRLPDAMEMLRITVASLPQVFICIDALDEFLPKNLPELLRLLRDIVRESPKTRIFLTGRPYVTGGIRRYFTMAVVIAIIPNTGDIKSYLEMRLGMDPEPDAMNDGLRVDILRTILERTSDMCVGVSSISTLSRIFAYQKLYVDSSLFHSTSKLFWERSPFVREERNSRR